MFFTPVIMHSDRRWTDSILPICAALRLECHTGHAY